MKKTLTAILLGILLIGTLGAAVVSAVASNGTKATDDLGQMHNLCGEYMNSAGTMHNGAMHNEAMHNLCGKYMNSGTLNSNNSNETVGQTYTDSGNSKGSLSCH